MIDDFYKKFRIKDYMSNEEINKQLLNQLIDCSLGTNPFIEEEFIKKYVLECSCEINKYPTIEYELLKEELLMFWNEYCNSKFNKCNLSFGAGAMGILRNISNFLIQEKTMVLCCAPQFPRFISEVELRKGILEYYSLEEENNFKFIIDDFLAKITDKYDVICIENPNNPTGQIIDVNDIEKIVKKANNYGIFVIVDEAYGDYMPLSNSSAKLVNKYNNIVVLRSASKFYGLPNHRIGYLFANNEFIKIYDEIALPFAFSDLSASVFRKIIKNYKQLDYTKEKVIEVNKKIYKSISKNKYLYTNIETPIFTVKSDKYENLSKELLKNGIIAENCDCFINLNSKYARIRINKDYEKLIEVLTKIL